QIGVVVHVHEPRRDDPGARVDRPRGGGRLVAVAADERDAVILYGDPSGDAGRTGAVDHGGVRDDEVHRRDTLSRGALRRWARTPGPMSRRRRAARPTLVRRAARRSGERATARSRRPANARWSARGVARTARRSTRGPRPGRRG